MLPIETNINWIDAVQNLEAKGEAYVLVTVLGTKVQHPEIWVPRWFLAQKAVLAPSVEDISNIAQI